MKSPKMKNCKFCGHEVAENAMACPKCGATLKKKHGCLTGILVMLGVCVAIIAILFMNGTIRRVDKNDITATIITNSGETVKMTRSELEEIYESNEAKFEKEYHGAKISYEFTVRSIETGIYFGSDTSGNCFDRINCKESLWNVLVLHDSFSNLDELEVGDRLYVESRIVAGADYVLSTDTVLLKK